MDDWRLMGQETYLQDRRLELRVWHSDRPDWDHDHWAFCQRHISVPLAPDDADAVDRGYSTEDSYHWVARRASRISKSIRVDRRPGCALIAADECGGWNDPAVADSLLMEIIDDTLEAVTFTGSGVNLNFGDAWFTIHGWPHVSIGAETWAYFLSSTRRTRTSRS